MKLCNEGDITTNTARSRVAERIQIDAYNALLFELVAVTAAAEALRLNVLLDAPFRVSQLTERIHNDTEDHVQTDCQNHYEEANVEDQLQTVYHHIFIVHTLLQREAFDGIVEALK